MLRRGCPSCYPKGHPTANDRIAQLTAELAEARKFIEAGAYERRDERDAALAELAEARRERANAQAAEAHAINAKTIAFAERDAAQAEAAAMHDALYAFYAAATAGADFPERFIDQAHLALRGTAGRALAARASLLEKTLERIAEIFPQLQSSFIHGEHGTAAKLLTALGVALAALDEKGGG